MSMRSEIDVRQFRLRNDLHIVRKLWHMGTGISGLYFYYVVSKNPIHMATILLSVALLGFAIDFARSRYGGLNRFATTLMKPFMRESEVNGLSGLPFYALGVSLSLFLYSEKIAVLSTLYLIFSDPISSYVAVRMGKDKFLPNKSVQGCLAGFITCYFITLFYCIAFAEVDFSLVLFAILGGAIGTISEILSTFGVDDNLTIPVVSGFALTLLNFFFHIF